MLLRKQRAKVNRGKNEAKYVNVKLILEGTAMAKQAHNAS